MSEQEQKTDTPNPSAPPPESGLPLPGYKPQSAANLGLVAEGKYIEERMLRYIDKVFAACSVPGSGMDKRFAAMGRSQIQIGCMLVYRAIMNPDRAVLPEDLVSIVESGTGYVTAPEVHVVANDPLPAGEDPNAQKV